MKFCFLAALIFSLGLVAHAADSNCDERVIEVSRSEVVSKTSRAVEDFDAGKILWKNLRADNDYTFMTYDVSFTAKDGKKFEVTAMMTLGCEVEEIACWDQDNDFCKK